MTAECTTVSKCFSKAPHIKSHKVPHSSSPKKVSLQLSSEQSIGDVWIAQLDRSSTSKVQQLQKFCHHNWGVFLAPHKGGTSASELGL